MKKPLIGIVMNYDKGGEYFSKYPWYALRQHYFNAIRNAGGAPIALPYHTDAIPEYIEAIDGLLITGGEDYPPEFYGEEPVGKALDILKGGRAEFDFKILEAALAQDMPVLGICAGQQAINIHFGGTLYQHIPDDIPDALNHMKPNPPHETSHAIEILPGTLLHQWTKIDACDVNTAHHQSVKKVGEGLVVNALAPDSVVEGIEHPGYRFCLGVEWHPEFEIDTIDRRIMKSFVDATQS